MKENSSTVLACETTSPGVNVQWYKNDQLITGSDDYKLLQQGTTCQLEILKASMSDNASFYCRIVSSKEKTTAHLSVEGKFETEK